MSVNCPNCGHLVFERIGAIKPAIIEAVREFGPIRAEEIAQMVYDGPYASSVYAARSIAAHVAQINRESRIIEGYGSGRTRDGYRLVRL